VDGGGRRGTIEDGRERVRTARDGGGLRQGTARVMSHDVKRIRLEVYDWLWLVLEVKAPGL